MLKCECFQKMFFKTDVFIFMDHLYNYEHWEMNDTLQKNYCPLKCSQITWVPFPMFKSSGCDAFFTEDFLEELCTKDVSFPFKIFLQQEIKQTHISLSSSYCSFFVTVIVWRQSDNSFSHSKSLSQIQNFHCPLYRQRLRYFIFINHLNPELNPICYLLALLGAHHFLHVSMIRDKSLTLRLLMSYIYIYIWNTCSWCF